MSKTVTVAIGANVYAALKAMATKEGVEPEMLLELFVMDEYSQSLRAKVGHSELTGTFGEPLEEEDYCFDPAVLQAQARGEE